MTREFQGKPARERLPQQTVLLVDAIAMTIRMPKYQRNDDPDLDIMAEMRARYELADRIIEDLSR